MREGHRRGHLNIWTSRGMPTQTAARSYGSGYWKKRGIAVDLADRERDSVAAGDPIETEAAAVTSTQVFEIIDQLRNKYGLQ